VEPRTTCISRQRPGAGVEQVLAANVDLIVIVMGLDPGHAADSDRRDYGPVPGLPPTASTHTPQKLNFNATCNTRGFP
jgi:hypothetical protein